MRMLKVRDLVPGNVFTMDMTGGMATFIVSCPHPYYRNPHMALVVWWLHEEQRYSFDALAWNQELPGTVVGGPFGPPDQSQLDRAWQDAMKAGNQ